MYHLCLGDTSKTYIQHVFLNDRVEYDANEKVEKYSEQILQTGTICLIGVFVLSDHLAVLQGHEQGGRRRGNLQRETKDGKSKKKKKETVRNGTRQYGRVIRARLPGP